MEKTGNIEYQIRKNYNRLRPSEQKVADYILSFREGFAGLTISGLAEGAGVSQPTIVRFANNIELKGFKELKYLLMEDEMKEAMNIQKTNLLHGFKIGEHDKPEDVPANVIWTTMTILKDTLNSISVEEFKRLIHEIVTAKRVFVFGVENSSCTVNDLVTKLLYLGINCVTYTDDYLQSVCAGNLTEEDLAIGISYSGCSKNTVGVLSTAKKAGAGTAAITNFSEAPISEYADINLIATTEQYLYGDTIFSRTSQLAIVDMIYTGILVSDYQKFTHKIDKSRKTIFDRDYREERKQDT